MVAALIARSELLIGDTKTSSPLRSRAWIMVGKKGLSRLLQMQSQDCEIRSKAHTTAGP
jgi:hypothetical protein